MNDPTVGVVDTAGRIFLGLHGHEFSDLQRQICVEDFLRGPRPREATFSAPMESITPQPVPGRASCLTFEELDVHPPPFIGDTPKDAPAVLHFNGNGKRY